MTIQMKINDGIKTITRNYHNIYKGVNLAELRENFFTQEEHSKWGILVQLKGSDRIMLARFGEEQEK